MEGWHVSQMVYIRLESDCGLGGGEGAPSHELRLVPRNSGFPDLIPVGGEFNSGCPSITLAYSSLNDPRVRRPYKRACRGQLVSPRGAKPAGFHKPSSNIFQFLGPRYRSTLETFIYVL